MNFSYDGRVFKSVRNSAAGDVGPETTFYYHQRGGIVWAEYGGGGVEFGQLIAVSDTDAILDARYQHINDKGELMAGTCRSIPEMLDDGRIRLFEQWQWTTGDLSSGESVIEEIRADQGPT